MKSPKYEKLQGTNFDDSEKNENSELEEVNVEQLSNIPSWSTDVRDLLKLAIPIFVSRMAWVGMKTTDTAREFIYHTL